MDIFDLCGFCVFDYMCNTSVAHTSWAVRPFTTCLSTGIFRSTPKSENRVEAWDVLNLHVASGDTMVILAWSNGVVAATEFVLQNPGVVQGAAACVVIRKHTWCIDNSG